MPKVDMDWVREQFQSARVKVAPGNAVLKMLEVWESLDISIEQAKEAVEIFSSVSLGHALVEENTEELWMPAQPGFITVGDEVRVLPDAFDGEAGTIHNGRRGKVVAVRHGDIVFMSTDDKEPPLESTHYSPYKLEKRYK
jgi:hypothetical protein